LDRWKQILLKPTDSLQQAIEVLDKGGLQIALVVDIGNRLLGTVTDGDVRRALIRHCSMDAPVSDVMYTSPTVASELDGREKMVALMNSRSLLQIPIVDDAGRIVGLETYKHLAERRRYDNPVFLMAGGFGKRLRPLTNDVPKPLLHVGGKPILETILERFIEHGFQNFYISTYYKADMVREHFGNGDRWGVSIEYVHEEEPLGTAGALGLLPDSLPDLPILMMNGDLLTKVNFETLLRFHIKRGCAATMCVREYDFEVPFGVVTAEGEEVKGIIEKPVHKFFVNAGIYVISRELIRSLKGDACLDMPSCLENNILAGRKVNMFPVHEYWLDIGRMDDFNKAQDEVK